jgi:hypothetical protein
LSRNVTEARQFRRNRPDKATLARAFKSEEVSS